MSACLQPLTMWAPSALEDEEVYHFRDRFLLRSRGRINSKLLHSGVEIRVRNASQHGIGPQCDLVGKFLPMGSNALSYEIMRAGLEAGAFEPTANGCVRWERLL